MEYICWLADRLYRLAAHRGLDVAIRAARTGPFVPTLSPLDRLHADYAKLVERRTAVLTEDQRRSLILHAWELAARTQKPSPPRTPIRVVQWFLRLEELEDFVRAEGRWPRQNHRAANGTTTQERTLATWVRTQRLAADQGRRCDYQMRRLAYFPGFHRHPLDDAWIRNVIAYRHFIETQKRAPRLRSEDPPEKKLAAFAAKQRFAYRQGRLRPDRIATLERLEVWTWGSTSPRS